MALNFHEVTTLEQCDEYLSGLADLTDLSKVAACTKAYRDKHGTYAKGFLFNANTLTNLIGQNSNIDGIRVYLGIDNSSGTETLIAVAVGTIGKDDFDIPTTMGSGTTTTSILAEGRPCPSQCGTDNVLSKP